MLTCALIHRWLCQERLWQSGWPTVCKPEPRHAEEGGVGEGEREGCKSSWPRWSMLAGAVRVRKKDAKDRKCLSWWEDGANLDSYFPGRYTAHGRERTQTR